MKQFDVDYCESPLDMELLSPYKNLLYCKLDLPELPDFNKIDLERFVNETNDSVVLKNIESAGSDRFASWANVKYPWKTAWIKSRDNVWFNGFDTKFPQLVNYISNFPIDSIDDLASGQILAQKENTEAFPHTDPDPWFGFRVYLSEESNRSTLYYHPSYTELETRPTTWIIENGITKKNDLSKYYDYSKKLCVKNNTGKFAFMLNSIRGCHGVEGNIERECDRLVLLLFFRKINSSKLSDLFSRSVVKYKDSCIWR